MIYSKLVNKACNIMFEAHKNDIDKGGYPYVFHPFYLATQMDDEYSICVSLLHDVIEDHDDLYSFDSLTEAGFPVCVIEALKCLTHDNSIPYMYYIKHLANNQIAKKVKIADLKHNLDSSRTNGKRAPKYKLYLEALNYLENN